MAEDSILDLLQPLKGDANLKELFVSLQELSTRNQAAYSDSAGDPRLVQKLDSRRSLRSRDASMSSKSGDRDGIASTRVASLKTRANILSQMRVEDVVVAIPPTDRETPFRAFDHVSEWDFLQRVANGACDAFTTHGAKLAWKRWALTKANAELVRAIVWWLIAAVFKPQHGLSAAIKAEAEARVHHQYVVSILTTIHADGSKDQYHMMWLDMLAESAIQMMRSAFPKSARKLDSLLKSFLSRQLSMWTTGALPGDLHPSANALADDFRPAALTILNQSSSMGARQATIKWHSEVESSTPARDQKPASAPSITRAASDQASNTRPSTTAADGLHAVFGMTGHSPALINSMGAGSARDIHSAPVHACVGRTHRHLHRPLDVDASAESYTSFAAASHAKAKSAVARYEEVRKQVVTDVTSIQRGLQDARRDIAAQAAKASRPEMAKKYGDKITGQVDQQTAVPQGPFAHHPTSNRSVHTDGHSTLHGISLLENRIHASLSGKRYNSLDLLSHGHAQDMARSAAARAAAGLPITINFSRGTKAIRVKRLAEQIIGTVPLESYHD